MVKISIMVLSVSSRVCTKRAVSEVSSAERAQLLRETDQGAQRMGSALMSNRIQLTDPNDIGYRYFVAYEVVKKALTPAGQDPSQLNLGAVITAGGLAGVAMWSFAIPPDVRPIPFTIWSTTTTTKLTSDFSISSHLLRRSHA